MADSVTINSADNISETEKEAARRATEVAREQEQNFSIQDNDFDLMKYVQTINEQKGKMVELLANKIIDKSQEQEISQQNEKDGIEIE